MFTRRYNVGDSISYTPIGGGPSRLVVVTEKYDDVDNGLPGFDGYIVGESTDAGVWGYDDQIDFVLA